MYYKKHVFYDYMPGLCLPFATNCQKDNGFIIWLKRILCICLICNTIMLYPSFLHFVLQPFKQMYLYFSPFWKYLYYYAIETEISDKNCEHLSVFLNVLFF